MNRFMSRAVMRAARGVIAKRFVSAGAAGARTFGTSWTKVAGGATAVTAVGFGLSSVTMFAKEEKPDWDKVKKDIAAILEEPGYDDGTYDKTTKTGGSDGATMRFTPEAAFGANAGLAEARKRLEPIKAKNPQASFADIYILASIVAIEDMGGPKVPFRPGRSDKPSGEWCPPDGRLPDADKGTKPSTIAHVREIFYRMGFDDQEIVALLGAHALGRCHTDRSGFTGPWSRAPTTFSNEYYRLLLESQWSKKNWKGPRQYENKDGADLMMLPSDLALIEDPDFKKYVEIYAKDEKRFFNDFLKAYAKLTELGCRNLEGGSKGWF